MSSYDPSSDSLRAFLWGKRESRRHPVVLPLEVLGAQGPVEGTSVDISATGILLQLTAADLTESTGPPTDPLVLIDRHFRDSFAVKFETVDLMVHADLVRVASNPGSGRHLHLGCRFCRALDEEQLRQVGLRLHRVSSEHDTHALPSALLPLAARDDTRLVARFVGSTRPGRVILSGPVLALGPRTLSVAVADADAANVLRRLRRPDLVICLRTGGRDIWRVRGQLRAVGLPTGAAGGIEIGLVTAEPAPPKVEARFRAREAREDDMPQAERHRA